MQDPIPPRPGRYIGIDLGGTNMQIGLVDLDHEPGEFAEHAEVTIHRKLKTKAELGLEGVLERMVTGIQEVCDEARIQPRDLTAIGLGAPSPVDPFRGIVIQAVNLRWNDVALGEILSTRLGTRVFLDNDVHVALVGEAHFGAGAQADPLLGVWVGTGVGGGLMLGGRIHYGKRYTAGEVGQMWLEPFGQPGLRTVEQFCSRTALVNRLRQLILSNHKTIAYDLVEGNLNRIRSKVLGQAYAQGDPLVCELCDHAGLLLGTHIGSLHTLLGLERCVLGGGLTEALGEPWVEKVRAQARRVSFPDSNKDLDVVATVLEDDAGILGAAMLAAQRIDDPAFQIPAKTPAD